jgi:hypothetical protein
MRPLIALAAVSLSASCTTDATLPSDGVAWDVAQVHTVPPPGSLALELGGDASPGSVFTLTATGVEPGDRVIFGRGSSEGAGPCPPELGGCVDLMGAAKVGTANANGAGVAQISRTVPADAPAGAPIAFQALVMDGAGTSSNVVSTTLGAALPPYFELEDLNPTSPTFGAIVTPRDHIGGISGWYFGHAT